MKRRFLSYTYIYIVSLLGLLAAACQSDLNGLWGGGESDGQSISVAVDISEVRTRVIDMNPGAAVYLKNIWIGVYDRQTGNKMGGTNSKIDLGDRLIASGNTIVDLVQITCSGLTATPSSYCVVGVANYEGIKTTEGTDLYEVLKDADTWAQFKDIAIDIRNSNFQTQTPVLAGYMENTVGSFPTTIANNGYIKVDQINNTDGIHLTGYGSDEAVYLNRKNATTLNTSNYVLKLRRMQSKINVIINEPDKNGTNPAPGITITNLEYKVLNNPGSAYLLQRRTNTNTQATYSPNSADVQENGYFDDLDWIRPQISTNFSFDHFENKHWAMEDIGTSTDKIEDRYHEREVKNSDGSFRALVGENGSESDWNNNASYFVLKMNIRDNNTGRNAEVYYAIHEGFINNEEGVQAQTDNERLRDFSCVRNTDYYYHITVRGVDDISVQVTTDKHTWDQAGSIWQVNYAKSNDVPYLESEETTEFGKGVTLKPEGDKEIENSDIAVRIVGSVFDHEKYKEYGVDVCYNFSHGDLDGFAGLWPEPTNEFTEYIVAGDKFNDPYEAFVDFCNGSSINAQYFNLFNDQLRIKYGNEKITIKEYLEKLNNGDSPNIGGYEFDGLKYYIAFDESTDDKRAHVRGIYIFDRQKALSGGTRIGTDADKCSFLYEINAAEQIPVYLEKENYQMVYATPNTVERISNSIAWNSSQSLTAFGNTYTGEEYATQGMILAEHPDIAFRILGFDGNTREYYDIFYNLGLNEYPTFYTDGSWPQKDLNGGVSKSVARGALSAGTIPQSLLDGLKVVVVRKNGTTETYDLETFIRDFENRTIPLTKEDRLGFQSDTYIKKAPNTTPDRNKYARALYLLDRKNPFNKPIFLTNGGKAATFQAYALKQAPEFVNPQKLTLPNGISTTLIQSTNKYYNIIDPSIESSTLPAITSVLPADYRYKITATATSGGNGTLYSYVNSSPVNGTYTFSVPMHYLPGTSGRLSVNAEPISEDYTESNSQQIGTYTLKTPPAWEYKDNDRNDWYYAYEYLKSHGASMYIGPDQDSRIKYLHFTGGNFYTSDKNTDGGYIRIASDVGLISFIVYKPCTIEVTANDAGYTDNGIIIRLDGNLKTYFDLESNNSDQKYSYTINESEFDGKEQLTVSIQRRSGANVDVKSIQVIP